MSLKMQYAECVLPPLPQRTRRPGSRELIVLLVLIVADTTLLGGCSRRKSDLHGSLALADTLANGLQRDIVPDLEPWLAMWQAAIPGLVPDSLRFGGAAPAFRGGITQPLKDFESLSEEEAAAFEVLMARSPDRRNRLIFDRYQTISEENGEVEIGGEPDSAPLLIDERLRLAHTFEFCGTPCGYDWGCWIDSVRFALGGWAEAYDAQTTEGVLRIYSLHDSTVARYFTRPVSIDEFARYREAWRAWVTKRYREQRAQATAHGG